MPLLIGATGTVLWEGPLNFCLESHCLPLAWLWVAYISSGSSGKVRGTRSSQCRQSLANVWVGS